LPTDDAFIDKDGKMAEIIAKRRLSDERTEITCTNWATSSHK
jgi:hypothetical protein